MVIVPARVPGMLRELLVQVGDEALDLLLHGFHFFAHIQNDLDTRKIHA
jgi:hypothetical protein